MTLVNLTTLFATPVNSAAKAQQLEKSSYISAFGYGKFGTSKDNFVSNPLYSRFSSAAVIEQIAKSNPRIMQILKENNLPLKINMEALDALKNGHLQSTRILAAKICSNLK